MASTLLFIFSSIFVFYLASSYAAEPKPTHFLVPIGKNETTLQYFANIEMAGSTKSGERLLVDLGGELVWINCDNYKSSSYRPIRCGSRECKDAKNISCIECYGTPKPGCTNNTCGVYGYNPYKNLVYSQVLGEDNITVRSTNGVGVGLSYVVPHFAFSCAYPGIFKGLASDITGSLALAKTKFAFHKQISSAFKLANKFYLCLPPVNEYEYGSMFIGGGPIYLSPTTIDFSKSKFTTPLVTNPVSTAPIIYMEGEASEEYFIGVKSIQINGKVVPVNTSLLAIDKNGVGGTKISTVVPYTVLHTSIYESITSEFVKKATSMKMKRVGPVKPFGVCFDSKTIANTTTGPNVPTIDLVLQNKDVYWRIYGHNSMVKAKKGVMCLAFTNGGFETRSSIVLGGYQLENNVIEFDLVSSKFGFSGSLLLHKTGCPQTRVF